VKGNSPRPIRRSENVTKAEVTMTGDADLVGARG